MTSADHLRAAQIFSELADAHYIDATFAAERGDSITDREELSGREFALRAKAHHEAQAAALVAPTCLCPGAMCNVCREKEDAEIDGLTNGPVHLIPANTPGDDAIVN